MSFLKKLFGKKDPPAEPEKPTTELMSEEHPADHPLTLEQKNWCKDRGKK